MSDDIRVETDIWIETQQQEVIGFSWHCDLCDSGRRHVYSYDTVELETAAHLIREHRIYSDED